MSTMHMSSSRKRSTRQDLGFDCGGGVGRVVWGSVVTGLVSARNALAKEIRIRRSMAELSRMGEAMLRDLGLTRLDVERAVRHGRF